MIQYKDMIKDSGAISYIKAIGIIHCILSWQENKQEGKISCSERNKKEAQGKSKTVKSRTGKKKQGKTNKDSI